MKIFNWVHRRFIHKDGLAENGTKSVDLTADEKQFLLENNNNNTLSANAFGGWKGGILTIGTFGYDPLKDGHEQINDDVEEEPEKEQLSSALENDQSDEITDYDQEEVEDDEEEVNPLVYAAAYVYDYEGLMEMKMEGSRVFPVDHDFEFDDATTATTMMKTNKKERTTLAELFSADSEELQKRQPIIINKGDATMIKEKSNDNKHPLSFAKKLVGEDNARPIHKLHRLMRRMLKRKIHPDLGVNKEHPANSKVAAGKCGTSEFASLLPITQGAII